MGRAGAAGAAGATWLTACARGGAATPGSTPELKPAQLRMYEWSGGPDLESANSIAEVYQQQQPKVQVSVEQPQAGGEPHYEQLLALFVAGGAPDVINTQSWRWHEFAAKNLLLPLDALRARDKFDQAWPKAWEKMYEPQTRFQGKLYARPYHWGSVNVVYSKELFDKFGVPYPNPDWTFDQFVDTARRLTRQEGDTHYYGFQSVRIYTRWFGWWRNDGAVEWDPLIEPRKANWTHPTVMERLSFLMHDVFHTLRLSPTIQEQGLAITIEQGKAAMKVEGPWFLPTMWGKAAARQPGTLFDVVPLPRGKSGGRVTAGVGHTHTISAQTKHQEACWDLVKFVAGDQAQEIVSRITGRQPITPEQNQKIWAPTVQSTFNFSTADAFIKSMEFGSFHLAGELGEGLLFRDSGLNDAISAMIAGEKKVGDVIPEANRRLQQLMDDFWAKKG
ncbi:MAG TPA: extracellular solute-binding protein [Chloroflexota bacterium]|nr:extracellular solute-binding protein [Chloroflexota bacterium]